MSLTYEINFQFVLLTFFFAKVIRLLSWEDT